MKAYNLYLTVALISLLTACSKPDNSTQSNNNNPNPNTTDPGNNTNTQTFEVIGLNAITLKDTDEQYLTLSIGHKSGEQGQVSLSVKDLPANIMASFSAQTGTPTFASVCTLKSNGAKGGNYKPSLVVKPDSGTEKSYVFNLKVNGPTPPPPVTDYRKGLVGYYTSNTYCSNGDFFTIMLDPNNKDSIILNGKWGLAKPVDSIYATIDTLSKQINIPHQTTKANQPIYGDGDYDTSTGIISNLLVDIYRDSNIVKSCNCTFKK